MFRLASNAVSAMAESSSVIERLLVPSVNALLGLRNSRSVGASSNSTAVTPSVEPGVSTPYKRGL